MQLMPLLIWFLLCSTGAYAFVQISSVPVAPAVNSAGAASGYRVANIVYALGAADPRSISSVKFTVTPASPNVRITTVRAKLVSSSSSYATCANTPAGSQSWICQISGVTVAAADQLSLDIGDLPTGPRFHRYLPVLRQ
jgi:hypothetical protein